MTREDAHIIATKAADIALRDRHYLEWVSYYEKRIEELLPPPRTAPPLPFTAP